MELSSAKPSIYFNNQISHQSGIPSEWKLVRLGEIALLVIGQSPDGATYNSEGRGIPLLNGPTEFGRSPTPVQFTTNAPRLCQAGDILLCVRGSTTGRLNLADQQYCIFLTSSGFLSRFLDCIS